MKAFLFAIVGFAWATAAAAQVLRADLVCLTATEIMDSHNQPKSVQVVQFIGDALSDADQPFVKARRGSIVQPLSEEGLTNIIAMVVTHCREHPDQAVKAIALSTYSALRALNSAMGLVR